MHTSKIKLMTSAILLELGLAPLQAATITVDNNTCQLADAITAANTDMATNGCDAGSSFNPDEIVLPQDATITLTEALPMISSEITIQGNGSTIQRDSQAATDFRIFHVYTTAGPQASSIQAKGGFEIASLTTNGVTITGGIDSSNNGAGILCTGSANTLVLMNSTVTNNNGSGIVSYRCRVDILDSIISNNTSFDVPYYGAGINIVSGFLGITNSTITGNYNQSSTTGGGGIYITNTGYEASGEIRYSIISGNTAVSSGGGIGLNAQEGIGLPNFIFFNLINSTISNNQSITGDGGGVFLTDPIGASVSNTITGNSAYLSGGGVAIRGDASSALSQSIISGNTANTGGNEIDVALTGAGTFAIDRNILGFNGNSGLNGVTADKTDIIPNVGLSAIILPLADNGGPTQTHALAPDSPAIDAVATGTSCRSSDQRGMARPMDGDLDGEAICDIGSFEAPFIDLIFENGFE